MSSSFKEVQEMLLFCLEGEIIDDQEFAVLYEEYTPQNIPIPHSLHDNFSLLNKETTECKANFRMENGGYSLSHRCFKTTSKICLPYVMDKCAVQLKACVHS